MKKTVIHSSVLSVALAIFAMLFGSGNIAFPLGLGRDTGDMALYAMAGFFATAVLVPLMGIFAMVLYDGQYEVFFARIGALPGRLVMLLCMLLIGPFCVIPRSISIAYASLNWVFPTLQILPFSIATVILLYVFASRRSGLLNLLGKVLGPVKLLLLSAVIIKGFFYVVNSRSCALPASEVFMQGLLDGYGTLDLLGVLFFTNIILVGLTSVIPGKSEDEKRQIFKIVLQGGSLGALLLGVVYAGFVIVSSFQSNDVSCMSVGKEQLLSALAGILLGTSGGILASFTVAIACLTTAVALTTVFAQYLSKDLFMKQFSYHTALYSTLGLALVFSNYGFQGIMRALFPVIAVLYPALIALTVANIVYKLWTIDTSKLAFYSTLVITTLITYGSSLVELCKF